MGDYFYVPDSNNKYPNKQTNPCHKAPTFKKNRKDLQLFRFSYKIAKTANLYSALTHLNTWIWRLKF
jgi:hypothetical protein